MRPIVAVSGGLDPIHDGHVLYILDAAQHGDVVVLLNSDAWLKRKKGYVFMPWHQRAMICGAIKGVVDVIPVDDADGTVCQGLRTLLPDFFAKGGDRGPENTPEVELCGHLGIECLWGIGGWKIESSSELIKKYENRHSIAYLSLFKRLVICIWDKGLRKTMMFNWKIKKGERGFFFDPFK